MNITSVIVYQPDGVPHHKNLTMKKIRNTEIVSLSKVRKSALHFMLKQNML